MAFTEDQIPKDVKTVWLIQWSGLPVGVKTFEWAQKVAKEYPEWFPADKEKEIFPKEKIIE